jgi:hypothetical protein
MVSVRYVSRSERGARRVIDRLTWEDWTMATERELRAALTAIAETVAESGADGAPEGPMYAALLGVLGLEDFRGLLGVLEREGLIRRDGHVAYATPKLAEYVARARALAEMRRAAPTVSSMSTGRA